MGRAPIRTPLFRRQVAGSREHAPWIWGKTADPRPARSCRSRPRGGWRSHAAPPGAAGREVSRLIELLVLLLGGGRRELGCRLVLRDPEHLVEGRLTLDGLHDPVLEERAHPLLAGHPAD